MSDKRSSPPSQFTVISIISLMKPTLESCATAMEKAFAEGPIPVVVDTPGDEPCAKIWSVYISEAEKYDKALVDSWRGNMNGMLIFAGLFSAILTAFIIESYKTLQPDTELAALLYISRQLADPSLPPVTPPRLDTPPPRAALVCNILWFISLGLSLASALTATLVEQWARDFLQRTEMLPSPVKRARIFAYLYYGLQRFRMHAVVGLIPLLLHLSLLFFFGGLVAFLFPVNLTVAYVAAALLATIILLYACMTVLPLLQFDCPYKTPMSAILWSIRRYCSLFVLRRFPAYRRRRHETALASPYLRSMVTAMVETATVRSDQREERDKRALAWTMKSLADDDELEPFVVGLPNCVFGPQGRRRKYDNLVLGLLTDPEILLGSRIEHLILSCESGLLEPSVRVRRQITCLNAIWALGMLSEKNSNPVQPLLFLKDLQFLLPRTPEMALYLPSIAALADWNNLCSMHGHVERLALLLRDSKTAIREGRPTDLVLGRCRRGLEAFLAERQRCNWPYLVTTSYGGRDLEQLSMNMPTHAHAAQDWLNAVSQIVGIIPRTSWNSVQYRILLTFLQNSTHLSKPPYEFELTCTTIQASLEPVDVPVGHVAIVFADNVRKAVEMQVPLITHNDTILGTLLPWFDAQHQVDVDMVDRVVDSCIEYINNRGSNEAVCRCLQDCNLTRVWERITARLTTCRPDLVGEVAKATWHLAALFPGLSTPDARLSTWPNFNGSTLSVLPIAPYSASVLALLKTHILNAFQAAGLRLHLQELEKQITANELPSVSPALKAELRNVETDWALLTAVCSLFSPLATAGQRPLPLALETFPAYTIQTHYAYAEWRLRALTAVHDAIELLPRFDRRIEEARMIVATEFMQCLAAADSGLLPYKAAETLDSLSTVLFASRPPLRDNQKNFAVALRGLTQIDDPTLDHSRLLSSVISSPLFNDPALPWLDDLKALSIMKSVLQPYLTATHNGPPPQNRKLEDVVNWLESKETTLVPDFLLPREQNGGIGAL